MSETNNIEGKKCKVCGKPVIDTGTGGVVHAGGGTIEQGCRNCGWQGGQVGKFLNCPRCGDGTMLYDHHSAS